MSFRNLVNIFIGYANLILIVLVGIGVLVFIYKIILGINASNSADGRQKLRDSVIYGLLGIFFIVSFTGVVNWITASLGI